MTVANSIKAMLDDAKDVMRRQMARIAELEVEVERLRSAAGAHGVLRSIYTDTNQPTGHRLKAAGLALGVETAPLKPVAPAIDATCEEVIPLAELVRTRRAYADKMLLEDSQFQAVAKYHQVVPSRSNGDGDGGNGSDNTES
jgi:hypothetical protein